MICANCKKEVVLSEQGEWTHKNGSVHCYPQVTTPLNFSIRAWQDSPLYWDLPYNERRTLIYRLMID